MQLLLDPVIHVHVHDLLQITRPRTKRQPIQRMQRALLASKFLGRRFAGGGTCMRGRRDMNRVRLRPSQRRSRLLAPGGAGGNRECDSHECDHHYRKPASDRSHIHLSDFTQQSVTLVARPSTSYKRCPSRPEYEIGGMTNSRSNTLGTVVLTLFALPFALGGLAAMSQAIRMATSTNGNPQYWVVALFGLVFTSIGCGLIFVAFYGKRMLQSKLRLQAEHPSEPWLWQADWAQGRVKSKTRGNTIGAWIFAVFWNVVSMPVAFLSL